MRLKLLLVILVMYLILPFASAKENISIEEIGTMPEVLIDGVHTWFFANLYNSGDTKVEIELEFMLDSTSVEKQKITIEPNFQKKITSNSSTRVSLGNKAIEAIVYVNEKKVANKSAQIYVKKREIVPVNGNNNAVFGYLLFTTAVVIVILTYVVFFRIRKKVGEKKIENRKVEISSQEVTKQAVPAARYQNIGDDFAFFLSDLKNQPDGYRQGEEYMLLIAIFESINNMMQNMRINNTEGAKANFENVKERTNSLISKFEGRRTDVISPAKVEIPQPVAIQKTEIFDKNEIKAELEKKRAETNHKKQFVDVLIPEFLLKIAEEKMRDGHIKAAEGLISAAGIMLKNDEVLQRLRKLREIGF